MKQSQAMKTRNRFLKRAIRAFDFQTGEGREDVYYSEKLYARMQVDGQTLGFEFEDHQPELPHRQRELYDNRDRLVRLVESMFDFNRFGAAGVYYSDVARVVMRMCGSYVGLIFPEEGELLI